MTETTIPFKKPKKLIGSAEEVIFFDHGEVPVLCRVDTGARGSAIWATNIAEKDGALQFSFFGPENPHYSGKIHHTRNFSRTVVANSMGVTQERYVVRLKIKLRKRRIVARFSLADRSSQVYPVLVGRNILRGKFLVDVNLGKPDRAAEVARTKALHSTIK